MTEDGHLLLVLVELSGGLVCLSDFQASDYCQNFRADHDACEIASWSALIGALVVARIVAVGLPVIRCLESLEFLCIWRVLSCGSLI